MNIFHQHDLEIFIYFFNFTFSYLLFILTLPIGKFNKHASEDSVCI